MADRERIELSDEQLDECREVFDLFDTDGNSVINAHELKIMLNPLVFTLPKLRSSKCSPRSKLT
jgi:Ca2+-binding EF-hand superfamily protein